MKTNKPKLKRKEKNRTQHSNKSNAYNECCTRHKCIELNMYLQFKFSCQVQIHIQFTKKQHFAEYNKDRIFEYDKNDKLEQVASLVQLGPSTSEMLYGLRNGKYDVTSPLNLMEFISNASSWVASIMHSFSFL